MGNLGKTKKQVCVCVWLRRTEFLILVSATILFPFTRPSCLWAASHCTHLSISTNSSDWGCCGVRELKYNVWKTSVRGHSNTRVSPLCPKEPFHPGRLFCQAWFQLLSPFNISQEKILRPWGGVLFSATVATGGYVGSAALTTPWSSSKESFNPKRLCRLTCFPWHTAFDNWQCKGDWDQRLCERCSRATTTYKRGVSWLATTRRIPSPATTAATSDSNNGNDSISNHSAKAKWGVSCYKIVLPKHTTKGAPNNDNPTMQQPKGEAETQTRRSLLQQW